jgi:hypothetical protein
VREDRDVGAREAEAVDQAGVVEGVAVDRLVGADQRAEDADIELKAARKQDGVLSHQQGRRAGPQGNGVLGDRRRQGVMRWLRLELRAARFSAGWLARPR